jgi:hypothetical protein
MKGISIAEPCRYDVIIGIFIAKPSQYVRTPICERHTMDMNICEGCLFRFNAPEHAVKHVTLMS